jgi:aspartate carbamoyltransferase regulatory subunit
MVRILLLLVLIGLVYLIIRQFLSDNTAKKAPKGKIDQFVKCSQCECHTPEAEAEVNGNLLTCNNPECIENAKKQIQSKQTKE